ncbi:hypothetical protein [Streptomyces cadmiisoli]|uniref:hypothetical protein n=1 Tax=Streptomyces cadmiisoli TaxID=2184053 RepID=UPI003658CE60
MRRPVNRSELLDEWKRRLAALLDLGEGLGTIVVMGRHGHPGIRDRVLDACVGHALAYGLPRPRRTVRGRVRHLGPEVDPQRRDPGRAAAGNPGTGADVAGAAIHGPAVSATSRRQALAAHS